MPGAVKKICIEEDCPIEQKKTQEIAENSSSLNKFSVSTATGISQVESYLSSNTYLSQRDLPGKSDFDLLEEIENLKFVPKHEENPNLFSWWWTLSPFNPSCKELWIKNDNDSLSGVVEPKRIGNLQSKNIVGQNKTGEMKIDVKKSGPDTGFLKEENKEFCIENFEVLDKHLSSNMFLSGEGEPGILDFKILQYEFGI